MPIMQLDHMWHAFTTKTLFFVEPTVVHHHLQRLVTKLLQCQEVEHDFTFRAPQYLLRYLDYVTNLAAVANNPLDFVDTNPFNSPDLKDVFSSLHRLSSAIASRCIDHILSEAQDGDLLTNVLLYVLFSHSVTMDDLGRMPGCNQRMAKIFLQKYWCLVMCNDIEGSDCDRVYFIIPSVQSYFEECFQGGARTRFCAQGFLVTYRCLKYTLYRYNHDESPADIDA